MPLHPQVTRGDRMNKLLQVIHESLPQWIADWFDILVPAVEVVLIGAGAWLAVRIASRLLRKLTSTYSLPAKVAALSLRVVATIVYVGATLWSLERMGVSGTVLWTAFTGFATVGAVAFFAAWSVLSNLFCALLIYFTGAFRIGDTVELLESGDKPGIKGRVLDINLVYTTLLEAAADGQEIVLQLPNSLVFQRVLRRWK
ncbi:mechanosensitive ion channel family protein [Cupriavidus plantarum]|uniref:mechanosensitive ion channel family protein n=2 Tax=Cupriavidus plantarum TaxID=942865 RepID=UPI00339D9D19